MASDSVGQRQMLDQLFARALERNRPRSVAVLGCSGGTGLEILAGLALERVLAIDINPGYLETLRRRFGASLPNLETVCGDLADPGLDLPKVDLVHAALIFEYLKPARLLANVRRWLVPGGALSAVLQLPAEGKEPVTPSAYCSLAALAPVMSLVPPDALYEEASGAGFGAVASETVRLGTGKSFLHCTFRQNGR